MAFRIGDRRGIIWRVVGPRVGRCVLILVGIGVIACAFWQPAGGDPLALLAISLGVSMVTVGCVIPWLVRLKAGPEGMSLEIRDRPAESNDLTTRFAEAPKQERVRRVVREEIAVARYLAADSALSSWFHPVQGPLVGCIMHLFLFDQKRRRLLPVMEPEGDESEGWAPGQGVTGEAYLTGNYVLATGAECCDNTYRLTEVQQRHYKELTAVASSPVWNSAGGVIAVLSASTTEPDPALATADGQEELLVLVQKTSRILIDLLGWFDDDEGPESPTMRAVNGR